MTSVSIAMATFNGSAFLRQQLDSIAAQTVQPLEVHIGDDGSTDDTENLVAAFAAGAPFPVHFHRNENRLGYGENFLRTAQRCAGEWIAFSDQDDVWLPNKIERALTAARSRSDAMLVVHDADLVDSELKPLGQRLYGFKDGAFDRLQLPGAFLSAGFLQLFRGSLIRDFPISPRTESPHDVEFDELTMTRFPHDSWIPLLANLSGSIVTLSDPLALYRRHDSTVTDVAALWSRRMVGNAFKNNADRYSSLAEWYRRSAEVLDQQVSLNPDPNLKEKLGEAADKFRAESEGLEVRADLYRSELVGKRARELVRLVEQGAYSRRWTMSARSFVKDLATVFMPPRAQP